MKDMHGPSNKVKKNNNNCLFFVGKFWINKIKLNKISNYKTIYGVVRVG